MTPKQEYEQRKAAKMDRRIAEEQAHEARLKREKATDEAVFALLNGVKAFFEGHASIDIMDPMGATQRVFFRGPKP